MQLAGYQIAIEIWDIISLLLPVGLLFVYNERKRKHKKRMDRLDLIYGTKGKKDEIKTPEELARAQAGEALLDDMIENN